MYLYGGLFLKTCANVLHEQVKIIDVSRSEHDILPNNRHFPVQQTFPDRQCFNSVVSSLWTGIVIPPSSRWILGGELQSLMHPIRCVNTKTRCIPSPEYTWLHMSYLHWHCNNTSTAWSRNELVATESISPSYLSLELSRWIHHLDRKMPEPQRP